MEFQQLFKSILKDSRSMADHLVHQIEQELVHERPTRTDLTRALPGIMRKHLGNVLIGAFQLFDMSRGQTDHGENLHVYFVKAALAVMRAVRTIREAYGVNPDAMLGRYDVAPAFQYANKVVRGMLHLQEQARYAEGGLPLESIFSSRFLPSPFNDSTYYGTHPDYPHLAPTQSALFRLGRVTRGGDFREKATTAFYRYTRGLMPRDRGEHEDSPVVRREWYRVLTGKDADGQIDVDEGADAPLWGGIYSGVDGDDEDDMLPFDVFNSGWDDPARVADIDRDPEVREADPGSFPRWPTPASSS